MTDLPTPTPTDVPTEDSGSPPPVDAVAGLMELKGTLLSCVGQVDRLVDARLGCEGGVRKRKKKRAPTEFNRFMRDRIRAIRAEKEGEVRAEDAFRIAAADWKNDAIKQQWRAENEAAAQKSEEGDAAADGEGQPGPEAD